MVVCSEAFADGVAGNRVLTVSVKDAARTAVKQVLWSDGAQVASPAPQLMLTELVLLLEMVCCVLGGKGGVCVGGGGGGEGGHTFVCVNLNSNSKTLFYKDCS